jgi:hypothetical protein
MHPVAAHLLRCFVSNHLKYRVDFPIGPFPKMGDESDAFLAGIAPGKPIAKPAYPGNWMILSCSNPLGLNNRLKTPTPEVKMRQHRK